MSRLIKIKAWNKEKKEWLCEEDMPLISDNPNSKVFEIGESWCEFIQFTGLHDRNGKEIWEGDILSFVPVDSSKFRKPFNPFEVFWVEKNASFSEWAPRDKVEVIGNIYENPDLLEAK